MLFLGHNRKTRDSSDLWRLVRLLFTGSVKTHLRPHTAGRNKSIFVRLTAAINPIHGLRQIIIQTTRTSIPIFE